MAKPEMVVIIKEISYTLLAFLLGLASGLVIMFLASITPIGG